MVRKSGRIIRMVIFCLVLSQTSFAYYYDGDLTDVVHVGSITASSSTFYDYRFLPDFTCDTSGLDEATGLLHSNDWTYPDNPSTWFGDNTVYRDVHPMGFDSSEWMGWVQYSFDAAYKLGKMWVWNFNEAGQIDRGLKSVRVHYSVDGATWTELGSGHIINQATGASGYAHNTEIDFNGSNARYVLITAAPAVGVGNWGSLYYFGLSEVRFTTLPSGGPLTVDAGINKTVALTAGAATVKLDGTVYGGTGSYVLNWTRTSGPAAVAFSPSASIYDPNVTFTTPGNYVLRLTANGAVYDEVAITVQALTVNAGQDHTLSLWQGSASIYADATVSGAVGPVSFNWSKISGPEAVSFIPGTNVEDPTIIVSEAGSYVFRLTANDGVRTASDEVGVIVTAAIVSGAYLPKDRVSASASHYYDDRFVPQNTCNTSGLDEFTGLFHAEGISNYSDYDHSGAMEYNSWFGAIGEQAAHPMGLASSEFMGWIQYSFDKTYYLGKMWVWNWNVAGQIDRDLKNVRIHYSVDGTNWTELGGGHVFNQAPGVGWSNPHGATEYAHNTEIDFGGIGARYVLITAASGAGVGNFGASYFGLGEVRFNVLVPEASNPFPADGAAEIRRTPTLSWQRGASAVSHDVYLGTDFQAVAAATNPSVLPGRGNQIAATYPISTPLALGMTYYWRIDAVNGSGFAQWPGNVWSFTVADYWVVENFESYASTSQLQAAWVPAGNAMTSLQKIPVAADPNNDVMQMQYNIQSGSKFADAAYIIPPDRADWTGGGVKALDIAYCGDYNNIDTQMYVILQDQSSHTSTVKKTQVLRLDTWQAWHIALSDFVGVDLQHVQKITLGLGDRTSFTAAAAGNVQFDDLRLYVPRCLGVPGARQSADMDGDCAVDYNDLTLLVQDWLKPDTFVTGLDGMLAGSPGWTNDATRGPCLRLNGTTNEVTLTMDDSSALQSVRDTVTVAFWLNGDSDMHTNHVLVPLFYGYSDPLSGMDIFFEYGYAGNPTARTIYWDAGLDRISKDASPQSPYIGGWSHWAFTKNTVTGEMNIYLNGVLWHSGTGKTTFVQPLTRLRLGAAYKGLLDDFRLYDVALSQSDVAKLADGSEVTNPAAAPLVWWKFNETSGSATEDFGTKAAQSFYHSVPSVAEIFSLESQGQRKVNFRDFAVMAGESWMQQDVLWPEN